MAEKAGVESVVGIDYSEKSIETANRVYPHHKVRRQVADIRDMLLSSGQYDLVVSFQVIEHLTDGGSFLADCCRLAKSGGFIAVVTPNRLRLPNRLRMLMGRQPKLGDPQHYQEYTSRELIELGANQELGYFGNFSYGLSARIPVAKINPLPVSAGLRIGHLVSSLADCICVIFKKEQ
jgi:SAM-dependent methyltransferase